MIDRTVNYSKCFVHTPVTGPLGEENLKIERGR